MQNTILSTNRKTTAARKLTFFALLVFTVLYQEAFSESAVPIIENLNGNVSLTLPSKLASQLISDFPEYRVPNNSDITGIWKYKVKQNPGTLPFISWGDFNGDGETDIALTIISKKGWKNLIYEGRKSEYVLVEEDGNTFGKSSGIYGPQQLITRTLKKGEPFLGKIFGHDSLVLTVFEQSAIVVYWDSGKYNSVGYAD